MGIVPTLMQAKKEYVKETEGIRKYLTPFIHYVNLNRMNQKKLKNEGL